MQLSNKRLSQLQQLLLHIVTGIIVQKKSQTVCE